MTAINRILNICLKHNGEGVLRLFFSDINKYLKPKNISGVKITEKLLSELCEIVEIDNIVISK